MVQSGRQEHGHEREGRTDAGRNCGGQQDQGRPRKAGEDPDQRQQVSLPGRLIQRSAPDGQDRKEREQRLQLLDPQPHPGDAEVDLLRHRRGPLVDEPEHVPEPPPLTALGHHPEPHLVADKDQRGRERLRRPPENGRTLPAPPLRPRTARRPRGLRSRAGRRPSSGPRQGPRPGPRSPASPTRRACAPGGA